MSNLYKIQSLYNKSELLINLIKKDHNSINIRISRTWQIFIIYFVISCAFSLIRTDKKPYFNIARNNKKVPLWCIFKCVRAQTIKSRKQHWKLSQSWIYITRTQITTTSLHKFVVKGKHFFFPPQLTSPGGLYTQEASESSNIMAIPVVIRSMISFSRSE